jgi:cytochrome P450
VSPGGGFATTNTAGERHVSTPTQETIEYPIERYDDLTVDQRYLDLQAQGPVRAKLPYGEPCWVATRYDDVKVVYGDKRFGKAYGVGRDTPRMFPMHVADDPTLLANMDPPDHTRVRRLTLGAFSASRTESLRGWVEGLADELLDDMAAGDQPADWEKVYAWELPLRVLTGILGVSRDEVPMFKGWIDELVGFDTAPERRGEVHHSLIGYIRGLIEQRRAAPTEDLLSVLVQARDADDRLSEDELVNMSMVLFLAGFETTAAQIGSTVYALMTHRDRWDELVAHPALLPPALEELWRWVPAFKHGSCMVRWAMEDVELSGGVVIRKGDCVVPEHQLANRDESVFPHGDQIDFHRNDPAPHLSLAWGAHRCLGASLAQLELEITLQKLTRRFPTLELAVPAAEVPWSARTFLRSPESLLLTW